MATLALAAAGAAAGSALLPAGLSILGATITGATIGAQVGALAGSFVDQALFAASGRTRSVTGPRLSDLRVTASSEGAPIPRLYGRARLGGQVIWATDFEEEAVTTDAAAAARAAPPAPHPSGRPTTATSPISPLPSPTARSPASAASGRTAASSICRAFPIASIPAARRRFPTA